jgi:hypothetical protein
MPDMSPGAVLTGQDSNSQVPSSPDISNLPAASGQAPTMQTPVQGPAAPAQPPATADMVHHSVLGRAIKSLVGAIHGTETQYQPNSTGGVSEVKTPAKPGAIFRQLLAGALIGGAVGSEPVGSKDDEHRRSVGGFLGGFSRGAAGVAQNSQQRDQAAFDRARERAKLTQEASREQDEHVLRQANIAHLNANTVALQHHMHALDEESLEKKNAASRSLIKSMTDAGATPAQISIDGKSLDTIPATDLAAEFSKNPGLLNGPAGTHRVFIDTTDAGELHWDGKTWRDDSGNVPNMAQHSSVRAFDVPTNTMKTPRSVPGATINQLRGAAIVDPEKNYMLSPEGLSSLYSLNLSDMTKRSQANQRNAAAKKSNAAAGKGSGDNKATEQAIRSQISIASKQLTAAQKSLDDDATKAAQDKLNDLYSQLNQLKPKQGGQIKTTAPKGKALVYDPQGAPHFVDRQKLSAFLKDPQFKGWHQ